MIECASAPARKASVTNPDRSECPPIRAICAAVKPACSARRWIISLTACPVIAVAPMAPVLCTVGNNARPEFGRVREPGGAAAVLTDVLVLLPSPGGGVGGCLPAEH